MFRIGDLIVDTFCAPEAMGAGMITEIKKVDEGLKFVVDFPTLNQVVRFTEKELISQIGIGDFEYYPVKRAH